MKCREMNPGNQWLVRVVPWCLLPLNEVPGDESRQCSIPHVQVASDKPSMKCREMNPGNHAVRHNHAPHVRPSMKCREMNPGNNNSRGYISKGVLALNEVPGDESRQ